MWYNKRKRGEPMDNNYYIYYELELINKALDDISEEDYEIEKQLYERKNFLEFLLNYA